MRPLLICFWLGTGHVNEKNFVGLSVTPAGYIATGSEDNSVVAYHASMPVRIHAQRSHMFVKDHTCVSKSTQCQVLFVLNLSLGFESTPLLASANHTHSLQWLLRSERCGF